MRLAAAAAASTDEAFALGALTGQLASAANGFSLFAGALLGGLLVVVPELHLAEHTLTLHLLFQGAERLINIVIAYNDLHLSAISE
jgi:hypothetical protein